MLSMAARCKLLEWALDRGAGRRCACGAALRCAMVRALPPRFFVAVAAGRRRSDDAPASFRRCRDGWSDSS
ncbi:hypothetical protein F511_47722 [Dorcoceras hygrometricum]|uniref:Uncharacterized protein n=1 Tax=Dorcoceras hygrometricum TaxID=472368 RepID=A0A2Z6ZWR2_9LAMI|nr:hypothetical protein F511_47722 [Dorcoceras hygrometricum]